MISDTIQRALLKTRPYGGTPIAASLDDLYYHLKHDVSDQFGSCRNRFALLMTDGYPDDDYRSYRLQLPHEGRPERSVTTAAASRPSPTTRS